MPPRSSTGSTTAATSSSTMSGGSRRLPSPLTGQPIGRREAAIVSAALAVLVVAWLLADFPGLSAARDTLLSVVAVLFLIMPGLVVAQLLPNGDQHVHAVALLSAGTIALGFIALGGLLLDLLPFGGISGTG